MKIHWGKWLKLKKISGSAVLRNYLEEHVGEEIALSELNRVCAEVGLQHWDRVIRNLKQQKGYDIINCPKKWYKLCSLEKKPVAGKRGNISKKLRFLVFERDNFTCQACGKTPREDGVKLSPDHIVPVDWGGETTLENLQALCRECNEGKQAWVTGEDAAVMSLVCKQKNTKERLRVYFEAHPNEEIGVDRLAVVGQTREWTRQLRYLKPEYGMKIKYCKKCKKDKRNIDTYIFLKGE